MPLGGSITYGVGSADGNGYREHFLRMLLSSGYHIRMVGSRTSGSMINNEHEGWRGYRLDQISNKLKRSCAALLPNIVAVNAGSNDCIQDYQLESFDRRMSDMLDYLWSVSPSSTVLLSTLLVNSNETINCRVLHVNNQIRRLAQSKLTKHKKIVMVDMQSVQGPQIIDLIDDGTHPNSVGYQKMATIWYEGFQQAVAKGMIKKL